MNVGTSSKISLLIWANVHRQIFQSTDTQTTTVPMRHQTVDGQLGVQQQKNKRKWQGSRCPHGHAFTPENTFYDKKGHRRCKECGRQSCKKRYAASVNGPVWVNDGHCKRGHELTEANSYRHKDGSRECEECRNQRETKRAPQRNMDRAVKRFKHPLILLNGIPPLIPWKSLPARWPETAETAAVLARKAMEQRYPCGGPGNTAKTASPGEN